MDEAYACAMKSARANELDPQVSKLSTGEGDYLIPVPPFARRLGRDGPKGCPEGPGVRCLMLR